MLEVQSLAAFYGRTQALFDVSFSLAKGECLALVGTNGSGKTTIIRSVLGLIQTRGSVVIGGIACEGMPTHRRVRDHGIAVVHEGRGLFSRMTVRENILVGLPSSQHRHIDQALDFFPSLRARLQENVSNLSGGQQQMVAIARAMARDPRLLLLDEPSLGLAPVLVDEIYGYLERLRRAGQTMLVVEQSIERAAAFADALCLIRIGQSVATVAAIDKLAVAQLVETAFEDARSTVKTAAVSETGG